MHERPWTVSAAMCGTCRQAQAHADVLQGKQPAQAPAGATGATAAAASAAEGPQQTGKERSSGKRPGNAVDAFRPLS